MIFLLRRNSFIFSIIREIPKVKDGKSNNADAGTMFPKFEAECIKDSCAPYEIGHKFEHGKII